ncbi:hypothetical protein QYE76_057491 [Lolium multiflorum]|uniref:Chromo domain-containing protein n=1 Tax=Lolium multiflorum TaxID=4521 RepID=A0AAD8T3W8_LOLMU|nr:hypothetical protein QYE76_057491 [Lolium multiflorum]
MQDWPQLANVTELRGFLGLTGYYRKFVKNSRIIARPLTNLLNKKGFLWMEEATEAFLALKAAMSSTPVLQLSDFQKQFIVETGACNFGIGAVLMQDQHPLAFLSKPLSSTHQQLSIYEKEFLVLLMAIERWRPYLQRGEFIIKTDHHSLSYLDDQTLQSPLQRKAIARLMGLQFKIVYRQGAENKAADALSRIGHLMENPKEWKRWLPLAEFWYNSTFHTAMGCSPFKALYGHDPNLGALPHVDETSPVAGILTDRAAQVELLKQHLTVAQNRMKIYADSKRSERVFEVGDKIKEFRDDYTPVFAHLPKTPTLDVLDTSPEKVLDRRLVKKGNVAIPQVLIKWTNIPEDSETWEDWETLKTKFLAILTWGQASSSGGGLVTPDGVT